MNSTFGKANFSGRLYVLCAVVWACLYAAAVFAAPQSPDKATAPDAGTSAAGPRTFNTAQEAADALVEAAENFNVVTLTQIFGPEGNDIVFSGEFAQDRKHAADFAAQARQKKSVSVD